MKDSCVGEDEADPSCEPGCLPCETYRFPFWPQCALPGIVEGRITHPAEAHRIKLRIEKPENIAIEIETPEATMPRFNPVVLLL